MILKKGNTVRKSPIRKMSTVRVATFLKKAAWP